jgi:hypothetical protein
MEQKPPPQTEGERITAATTKVPLLAVRSELVRAIDAAIAAAVAAERAHTIAIVRESAAKSLKAGLDIAAVEIAIRRLEG